MPDKERMRLDKWLWCARFFKSRSLANRFCSETGVRIAGTPVRRPHYALRVGDVLTFPLGSHIRTVRVKALAMRRGPATEARTLYEELSSAASTMVG